MIRASIYFRKRCWLWHEWVTAKETAVTAYQICMDCGAKRIVQNGDGYQPVDFDFLLGKSKADEGKPQPYQQVER